MRFAAFGLWAVALLTHEAVCQDGAGTYCDELDRCFVSYTTANGITYGFALPQVTTAPFDAIVQITAPRKLGWVGFSWGGGMTYNPLAITWVNGDEVQLSSRMAFAYAIPTAYAGAKYKLLDGSYVNSTHFVTTALCQGCSAWDATGANAKQLKPSDQNAFAYAYSERPVNNPGNVDTTFSIHQGVGHWDQNLAAGQSPKFAEWAGRGGGNDTSTTSTTPPATSTSSEISTSATSSAEPTPTGPIALPESCDMQSRFPLKSAPGWTSVKIAGGLTSPRGMVVDAHGNLLVVEPGKGITVHTFKSNGCIGSSKTLISNRALNHGITLTPDGTTLVVSSYTSAWRYTYDPVAQAVSDEQLVVKGMEPRGHVTRTAVIPPDTPDLLILSVGSLGNLDWPSLDKSVGRALLKVFNLTSVPEGGYDYRTSGWFLGYGLRNEVAVVVDNNNMVWGVENSADEFNRTVGGVVTDIHEDNPAEELNFLGDPSVPNEKWYGYPTCFTVWSGDLFPDGKPTVGSQFIPEPNCTWTDARCEEESVPPRLSLRAHSAPIDGKFDKDNSNLYVSLHGSWNRETPYGFKVVQIPFTQNSEGLYEPVAAADSAEGYNDILWDPQERCSSSKCFRPSGISWDKDFTRMYVASDNNQEGEIYILAKTG